MKNQVSTDLFAQFIKEGGELHKNRSINRKTTFHNLIEDLGGEWVENEYKFEQRDRILVREEIKKAEATYKAELVQKTREEETLLLAWSKITYGDGGMEFAELRNYEGIDDRIILHLNKLAKEQNQTTAKSIIDAWTKEVEEMESDNALIDGRLFSKILHKIDKTLNGYFIKGMKSLIDLPFTQSGEMEIVLTADPKIELFNDFIWDNRKDLERTIFHRAAGYGKPKGFKTIMDVLCKTMNWDFEFIKAEGGKVQAQKDLIAYYKKTKIPGVPRTSLPQKQWLFDHLMFQRKNRRLKPQEMAYFKCMADRAIIRQRPHILNTVFHSLKESRIDRGIQIREAARSE